MSIPSLTPEEVTAIKNVQAAIKALPQTLKIGVVGDEDDEAREGLDVWKHIGNGNWICLGSLNV